MLILYHRWYNNNNKKGEKWMIEDISGIQLNATQFWCLPLEQNLNLKVYYDKKNIVDGNENKNIYKTVPREINHYK